MLRGWKITYRILGQSESEDKLDVTTSYQNSLANAVNMFISFMIDLSIPHNILIAEGGKVFYIIPRNFNEVKSNLEFNTNWLDLCGFLTVKTNEFFDNAETRINEFFDFVRNSLTVNEKSFNEMKENIFKNFKFLYNVKLLN